MSPTGPCTPLPPSVLRSQERALSSSVLTALPTVREPHAKIWGGMRWCFHSARAHAAAGTNGFLSWRNVTCDCTLEACRTQYYWRVLPVSLWQSMGKKNGGLQHLCVYRC